LQEGNRRELITERNVHIGNDHVFLMHIGEKAIPIDYEQRETLAITTIVTWHLTCYKERPITRYICDNFRARNSTYELIIIA